MLRARSAILMGWPISRRKISASLSRVVARRMSSTASGMVMKKRVTSGWVTVTGPPRAICSLKIGTTLPLEASTLPKRTERKRPVACASVFTDCTIRSATRLVSPITLVGCTALSVETSTKFSTPLAAAMRTTLRVPTTLLRTVSRGFFSARETCL